MHRFYIPYPIENPCMLGIEESRHCIKVLRLKTGDELELTDGQGGLYEAIIAEASPKGCLLNIIQHHKIPTQSWQLRIAVAPTKNLARMEWLVEKLTEIGITEFLPISSSHSERKIIKTDRLQKICIEAMKQSGRTYLPVIQEIKTYSEILKSASEFKGQKFILHCHGFTASSQDNSTFVKRYNKGQDALVLIGPEGDFSHEEVQKANEQGFVSISLGMVRYRTETAALAAAITLQNLNG